MAVYQLLLAIFSVSTLLAAVKGQMGRPPPQCSDGKIFRSCGTECPRTCANLGQPLICTRQCVSGCFCPSGTVENGDSGCVQPSDCPGQTTMSPTTTSVTQVERSSSRSNTLLTTTISEVTTNSSTPNTSTQTNLGIIVGASAAAGAAVILVILILVVLLTVILVRRANSRLEKSPGSSNVLDTSKGVEKNFIPTEMNAAYAAVITQRNIAYTTANQSSANDYEEYTYI